MDAESLQMLFFQSLLNGLRPMIGEVLEYALIAGLIVVAAIGVIGKVGSKVLARWGSLNSSV